MQRGMTQPPVEDGSARAERSPGADRLLSYEQFLDWADEDTHAEWVGGKVVWMSPVSRGHAQLKGWLYQLLAWFVAAHELGEVYDEPFQMKLGPDLPGRSPDILVVRRENLGRLRDVYLDGPADLVVEIISPESRARDRVEKFREYEAGGVAEFWLIDPQRRSAEFYSLGEDGCYRLKKPCADGRFRSVVVPGFWITVERLWQRPLKPLLEVLKEWSVG